EVLEPAPAEALAVETRLQRDDVAGNELRGAAAPEARRLVNLQPDPVAEAVEEPVLEHLTRRLREDGRLPGRLEVLAYEVEDLDSRHPRLRRLERLVERLLDERVVGHELLRGRADDERPRHVRVAGRLRILGPEVDHDRLVGRDLAVSELMADGRLRP